MLAPTHVSTKVVGSFVPYVLFEVPSNLLLKRFKPHVWRMCYRFPYFHRRS